MSDKDKKVVAIVGAIILVVIALLFFGKKKSVVYNQTGDVVLPAATLAGMPTFTRAPFVLPDLNYQNNASLSAIGACCSDCSEKAKPTQSYKSAANPLTFVFNEGNKGPNIFNYIKQVVEPVLPKWAYSS
jgi:hypothetical protein